MLGVGSIDLSSWRLAPWRFLRSLLAILVSLLLLGGAAIEAGRRLLPPEQELDDRLVRAGLHAAGPA